MIFFLVDSKARHAVLSPVAAAAFHIRTNIVAILKKRRSVYVKLAGPLFPPEIKTTPDRYLTVSWHVLLLLVAMVLGEQWEHSLIRQSAGSVLLVLAAWKLATVSARTVERSVRDALVVALRDVLKSANDHNEVKEGEGGGYWCNVEGYGDSHPFLFIATYCW